MSILIRFYLSTLVIALKCPGGNSSESHGLERASRSMSLVFAGTPGQIFDELSEGREAVIHGRDCNVFKQGKSRAVADPGAAPGK